MPFLFVKKDHLLRAVFTARATVPAKSIKEEDGMALIEICGPILTVSTYDSERSAWTDMEAESSENIVKKFLIDPVLLDRVLKKCDSDTIEIAVDEGETNRISVFAKAGRKASVTIEIFSAEKRVLKSRGSITDAVSIERAPFVDGLKFCQKFLSKPKDNMRRFDFITVDKGVFFGSNGSSRRGYVVDKRFATISGLAIHKDNTEQTAKILSDWDNEQIEMQLTEKSVLFATDQDGVYTLFSVDRAVSEPIPIKDEYLSPAGPHSKVDFRELSRALDRCVLTDDTSMNEHIGMFLDVDETDSVSTLHLILADDANGSYDSVPITRVGDSGAKIRSVVDAKMLKEMLKAFTCKEDPRIYVNDPTKAYFKLMASTDIGENGRRFEVSVGSKASLPGRR